MAKSLKNYVDPVDLIEGSTKMSTGTRKYGFGIEVLRLWASLNDG